MAVDPSVAIGGSIAQRLHHGGHAWAVLQYVLGFKQLGFKVTFIDSLTSDMLPGEDQIARRGARTARVRWLSRILKEVGLEGSYSVLQGEGEETVGLPRADVIDRVRSADFLLNVMGFLQDAEILRAARRRVFLDIDPGFGQMWNELELADIFSGHDDFFTIAENIGHPECKVPDCGVKWLTTRQPIVLNEWPQVVGHGQNFTSVITWRGPFAPINYEGRRYGLRAHEFRRFVKLPEWTGESFALALNSDNADSADRSLLRRNGWQIIDPAIVAGDLSSYRAFIQRSAAEFMVAKQMYVTTRSGWFSDRSACYLASAKPVLAQDTGFAHNYPVGEGLLSFGNLEEAVEGVREISGNWDRHSTAARAIAEEYFDSTKVLSRLSEGVG